MKKSVASIAAVVLLSALPTGPVRGQVIRRPPIRPSDVVAPPEGVTKRPKKEILGTLDIKRFDAKRDSQGINISGEIRNTQATGVDSVVTWSILRQNGNGWTKINSGTATVKGYSTHPVTMTLPASNDALRLRFDVSSSKPSKYTAKEFNLAARDVKFVILYRTGGWVLIRDDREGMDPNKLIGEEASKVREALNSLGFKTEMRITKPGLIGNTNRTMLYARAENEIERSFDSRSEADEFARSLKSLVPANARDFGTGLRMRRLER
ncbi:MAG: hypothetical protein WD845_13895 [Pirellulales bacterium]